MRRRNSLKTSLGAAGAALTLASLFPALTFAGAGPLVPGAAAQLDAGYSSLRQAFENPPNDNRNWTRWWWFGPQANEPGIAYELEQMHKQGLGGVEMQWVTRPELEGNLDFLSEVCAPGSGKKRLIRFLVRAAEPVGGDALWDKRLLSLNHTLARPVTSQACAARCKVWRGCIARMARRWSAKIANSDARPTFSQCTVQSKMALRGRTKS